MNQNNTSPENPGILDRFVQAISCGKLGVDTQFVRRTIPRSDLDLLEMPDFIDGNIAGWYEPKKRLVRR